ncbi:MAG TPA: GtrA family protein [Candidatus Nanoarchaeia archaeon]|nr:GtrA family protein [Candidatus Nanoarchaeia archaeon]
MLRKLKKSIKYQYSLLVSKYLSDGFQNIKLGIYVKYVIGGVSLFIVQALIVLFLTKVVGVKFLFAYAVALALYVVLAFVYHNEFTFKKMVNVRKEAFRKFLIYMGISSSLSYSLVFILTTFFIWAYFPALFTVAICMSVINFIVNAGWIF